MKKIPIIIPLILMLTTAAAPPTWALYKDDDGATWYTVEELLDYRKVLDREKEEACGDDAWCQQEYYFNKMEEEPKVLAVDQFMQQQFVLTAANPGDEYIKVWFFGEDTMLSHMGIHEEIGIEMVYIGWLEDEPERIYSQGMDYDKYTSGEIDGLHTIYAWRNDSPEENLIRSDEEIVLDAKDLIKNTSGQLVYFVDSGEGKFNAVGRLIYTNCLSETDYSVGAECKLMTSAEKGQAYYPPRKTVLSNDEEMSTMMSDNGETPDLNNEPQITDDIDASGTTDEPGANDAIGANDETETTDVVGTNGEIGTADEIGTTDVVGANGEIGNADENGTTDVVGANGETGTTDEFGAANEDGAAVMNENNNSAGELNGVKFTLPSAPNTGVGTGPCSQKTIEFPWWLVALIALGDAAVMWLFWPNRKKNEKK